MEYFAQDEATRLDPALTVYETLASGSPMHMVGSIRNILGGFLFSGDDVYKKAGVLSGGERTRLAVARMLLRPSNTLLLDEPTNHLDLDSKDVLLDALEDYGGTLIIVSHDRYFVERLATKIIEIGHGEAVVYPGTYAEFLWRNATHPQLPTPNAQGVVSRSQVPTPNSQRAASHSRRSTPNAQRPAPNARGSAPAHERDARPAAAGPGAQPGVDGRDARKRLEAERRKRQRALESVQKRIADLEGRIATREAEVRELEAEMAAPGFYEQHEASRGVIDRHQALMWEVGELMAQWEALQEHAVEETGDP
jgi:ATP-binding cassette subfamily F protein 3